MLATAKVHRVDGVRLNPVLGYALNWMPDQKTLLVKTVPAQRGAPPSENTVPAGPRVEDSTGVKSASSTYEAVEVLKTPYDQDAFEFYTTAQVALVDPLSGKITTIGSPAVLLQLIASPSGQYLLVERIERPYSPTRMFNRFPTQVEVWDLSGTRWRRWPVCLGRASPIDGVRTGPRDHQWRPTAPATVVWEEALDEGDTYKKVPHHDRVMLKPIGGTASELMKTEQRFDSLNWIERGGLALADRGRLRQALDEDVSAGRGRSRGRSRLVWSLNFDDSYHNPGDPVFRRLPNGASAVREFKGAIFTSGEGASPPAIARFSIASISAR